MCQVEGTCSGAHGYIVAVTNLEQVGKGAIREGTGFAQVTILGLPTIPICCTI